MQINNLQHLKTLIVDYPLVVQTLTYNTIESLADEELLKGLNRRSSNNLKKLKSVFDKGDRNSLIERFNSLPKVLQDKAKDYSKTIGTSIVFDTIGGNYL